MKAILIYLFVSILSYFIGSVPFSYIIVKVATGKDLQHIGTGNIGAMNVRRATGSWMWFFTAMILDGLKGFLPVYSCYLVSKTTGADLLLLKGLALNFSVLGHNYSLLFYLLAGKIASGRGLATGGGALLAYNPVYLIIALCIGLPVIFITRYLLAGQILTPLALPVVVFFLNREDFFAILAVCIQVLIRHAERIPSLLKGKEPQFYVDEKDKKN